MIKIMEDKNLKEAEKVVLTDEELMEIVGGTGDQDGPRYSVAEFCQQFETFEECFINFKAVLAPFIFLLACA